MHIEQFLSKFPCRSQQVHVLSSLLMNGTCLSTSLCYVFLVYVECGIILPYYDGPSRNRRNDNIADEHRCFLSQERHGQLEEIVVLKSFIGQLYQSLVWMFIYSVYNICRDMNELLIMG